jgi:DNA invertase Pin-like site-specific DNA recombinase
VFSTSAAEAGYLTDDPDDASRKLIRQVLGAVAEYERSMTALRLRSGRQRKAKDGGYAYGSPPFGYRVEDGDLVPDEGEQDTIGRALELQKGGSSIRAIATTLTQQGRLTKRGGTRWHPTTVVRVLGRS